MYCTYALGYFRAGNNSRTFNNKLIVIQVNTKNNALVVMVNVYENKATLYKSADTYNPKP